MLLVILMPLHRQACLRKVNAQLIWETSARVIIDYCPGSGMMTKGAMMMGCKSILVAHNPAHVKVLQGILKTYVRSQIDAGNTTFSPADKDQRVKDLKPKKLVAYESQPASCRKRPGDEQRPGDERATKRAALAESWDAMLDSLAGRAQAKGLPKAAAAPKAAEPAPAPAAAPKAVAKAVAKASAAVPPAAGDASSEPTTAEADLSTEPTTSSPAPVANLADILKAWAN